MRALLVLLLCLPACKGKTRQETAAHATDAASAAKLDPARCTEALRASADADGLDHGLGLVLQQCQPCGVAWDPLVAASSTDPTMVTYDGLPDAKEVFAVLDACQATCKGSARDEVQNALVPSEYVGAPSTPWRKLAERCPGAMHVDEHTMRFARGTWYALEQIARANPKSTAEFPLPPFTAASTAFALPRADGLVAGARVHVTVTDKIVYVGVLPWVTLAGGVPTLVPGTGLDYPGVDTKLDELAKAMTALQAERSGMAVMIAPKGLPLARVVEVLAKLPARVRLAATPKSKHDAPWPEPLGAVPVELAASPGGPTVPTIDASKGAIPDAIRAATLEPRDGEVALVLPSTAQVADLAQALVDLRARGVDRVDLSLR